MTNKIDINKKEWHNRILIATPATGLVRMEWVHARYGQIIPTNWSQVELTQWINSYVPMQYLLPDAENLVAKVAIEGDFEWVLSIEQDNVLPTDAFFRVNEYMKEKKVPIVSGLYFTKSNPSEPIMYRGRGNGAFEDWKLGDKVWVDGIPFGFTLMHTSILKALWDESPEYEVNGQITRRVFGLPDRNWGSPEEGYGAVRGTTDLAWCSRIMDNGIFKKAGWDEYEGKKNPFLVDTNIMLDHIDNEGRKYPLGGVPAKYLPNK